MYSQIVGRYIDAARVAQFGDVGRESKAVISFMVTQLLVQCHYRYSPASKCEGETWLSVTNRSHSLTEELAPR